jgi:hypothetical protein
MCWLTVRDLLVPTTHSLGPVFVTRVHFYITEANFQQHVRWCCELYCKTCKQSPVFPPIIDNKINTRQPIVMIAMSVALCDLHAGHLVMRRWNAQNKQTKVFVTTRVILHRRHVSR